MRRSGIETTRQLTMQNDGAQGTCRKRQSPRWSGLNVDLLSLTAYDPNRHSMNGHPPLRPVAAISSGVTHNISQRVLI